MRLSSPEWDVYIFLFITYILVRSHKIPHGSAYEVLYL